jgi:hypothetical protein
MPTVHLTLSDTPQGGVSIKTDFSPAIGLPTSPAQSAALDILNRTRKQWGMAPCPPKAMASTATASTPNPN